jgi:perosamine synthetase
MEPAYTDVHTPRLPATEALSLNSLILPVFHGMTEAQQDRVTAVLKAAAGD